MNSSTKSALMILTWTLAILVFGTFAGMALALTWNSIVMSQPAAQQGKEAGE